MITDDQIWSIWHTSPKGVAQFARSIEAVVRAAVAAPAGEPADDFRKSLERACERCDDEATIEEQRATIEKLIPIATAAVEWWRMYQPLAMTEEQHALNPGINCNDEHEIVLASAVAAWLRMAERTGSDDPCRHLVQIARDALAACWYCGAAQGDECQKPFADVPCRRGTAGGER